MFGFGVGIVEEGPSEIIGEIGSRRGNINVAVQVKFNDLLVSLQFIYVNVIIRI